MQTLNMEPDQGRSTRTSLLCAVTNCGSRGCVVESNCPDFFQYLNTMNALRNRVLLIGRLGQDPERIEFEGEKVKVNLRLATNEVYRNANGEKMETTQWHNVIAWGQLADIMTKYLFKGNEVAIEGRLVYRHYEDKMGQQRVAAEIVTQEMLMLDRPIQDA